MSASCCGWIISWWFHLFKGPPQLLFSVSTRWKHLNPATLWHHLRRIQTCFCQRDDEKPKQEQDFRASSPCLPPPSIFIVSAPHPRRTAASSNWGKKKWGRSGLDFVPIKPKTCTFCTADSVPDPRGPPLKPCNPDCVAEPVMFLFHTVNTVKKDE